MLSTTRRLAYVCNSVRYYIFTHACVRLYINNRNYYYNNAVRKLFRINLISKRRAAAVRLPEK